MRQHDDMEGRFLNTLKDAGLLLLVVVLCPLAILIVATPVVLLVRLLIEIADRM